jgi:putative multicomponent Na+:H+ antiporter subunit B
MNEIYIYAIAILLPLTALMVVLQTNPYRALVIRGILGAVAALVYVVLGAADVALTEALVGTLLAITLYAVAVRSSMVLRLGVLKDDAIALETDSKEVKDKLQGIFSKRFMRVELVYFPDKTSLSQALDAKEIHATCTSQDSIGYSLAIRLRHLYEIVQTELKSSIINLSYFDATSINLTLPSSLSCEEREGQDNTNFQK